MRQNGEHDPAVVRREHRGEGEDGEEEDTPGEGGLAADAVGEAAPGDGADHRAEPGHGEDPAGLEAFQMPGGILEQAAHGEADEEHVEELRHVAHDDEQDEVLLVLGEGPGIDLLEGSHAGGCGRCV